MGDLHQHETWMCAEEQCDLLVEIIDLLEQILRAIPGPPQRA